MTHSPPESLLVFTVDHQRFALAVSAVEKVVEAVELVPIPDAPPAVRGAINYHGALLPVFDIRMRQGMSPLDVRVSDYLIIALNAERRIALLVHEVNEVVPRPAPASAGDVAAQPSLDGTVQLPGGLVLIENVERFLARSGEGPLGKSRDA